eukprot:GFYU01004014.1.p1 GENE.GFYU01004014.1~~GFYU01004014.1.p1  ORF type:complete len:761 (-),score=309.57 GFYU01004014.1:323-2605(-)
MTLYALSSENKLPPLPTGAGPAAAAPAQPEPPRRGMSKPQLVRRQSEPAMSHPTHGSGRPLQRRQTTISEASVTTPPDTPGELPEGASIDEVWADNARLRAENRQLQSAIVDRYRGPQKFVSGGQFKGVGKTRVVEKKCASCTVLKNTLSKLRQDGAMLSKNNQDLENELVSFDQLRSDYERTIDELQARQQSDDQRIAELEEILRQERLNAEDLRNKVTTQLESKGQQEMSLLEQLQQERAKNAALDSKLEQSARQLQDLELVLSRMEEEAKEKDSLADRLKREADLAAQNHQEEYNRLMEQVNKSHSDLLSAKQGMANANDELNAMQTVSEQNERFKQQIVELDEENKRLHATIEQLNVTISDLQDALRSKDDEIALLRQELDNTKNSEQSFADYKAQMEAEIRRITDDLVNASKDVDRQREESDKLKAAHAKGEETIKSLRAEIENLHADLGAVNQQLDEATQRALLVEHKDTELKILRGKIDELEADAAALQETTSRNQKLEDQLKALTDEVKRLKKELEAAKKNKEMSEAAQKEIASKQKEIDRLQKELKEALARLDDMGAANLNLEAKVSSLTEKVECLTKEADINRGTLESNRQSNDDLERENGEMLKKIRNYQNRTSTLAVENAQLKKDLGDSEVANKSLLDKANTALQRLKAQALEMTLQSLLHLCVVAPTVNVSFGSQLLNYKANLPKDKIRQILEDQILPRFTKMFLQVEEGLGPDGTNLDKWLEGLIAEMKDAIEKHLLKVFKEQRDR